MPHDVMLSALSESGGTVRRERPDWIGQVDRGRESREATVKAQYAVLGVHDVVTTLEAPDHGTVAAISIEMGALGSVPMMTMEVR